MVEGTAKMMLSWRQWNSHLSALPWRSWIVASVGSVDNNRILLQWELIEVRCSVNELIWRESLSFSQGPACFVCVSVCVSQRIGAKLTPYVFLLI